jgi:23S rRNA (adenine2503-C2)-methyltransferase
LRDALVPLNRKYPLAELMAACQPTWRPRRATSSPSNTACSTASTTARSRRARAGGLVNGQAGTPRVPCKFNLIPFNPFPQSGLLRSPRDRVQAFARCCRTPAS